jgi:hypothetical protein
MTGFATAADWLRFLKPIAMAVSNPPTDTDAKGRAAALAYTMRVPPESLTASRQRELCRTCQFWPSVAEVEKVFAEAWKDAARSRSITGGIANALPAPPAKPIDVEASVRNFRAVQEARDAMRAEASNSTRPPDPPRHLTPDQLRRAYATWHTDAARFRLAQLEQGKP